MLHSDVQAEWQLKLELLTGASMPTTLNRHLKRIVNGASFESNLSIGQYFRSKGPDCMTLDVRLYIAAET